MNKTKPLLELKSGVTIYFILGYDDGYYWDYRVGFTYKNKKFIYVDFGSDSGYIPCGTGIAYQTDPDWEENVLIGINNRGAFTNNIDELKDSMSLDILSKYAEKLIKSSEDELDFDENGKEG